VAARVGLFSSQGDVLKSVSLLAKVAIFGDSMCSLCAYVDVVGCPVFKIAKVQ
jgi:hypothetical protein